MSWLSRLPDLWKGLLVIVGAISIGGAGMATAGGFWALPGRFEKHVVLQGHQIAVQDSLMNLMDRRLTAVEAMIRMQTCLTIADLQRTPWQACMPSVRP